MWRPVRCFFGGESKAGINSCRPCRRRRAHNLRGLQAAIDRHGNAIVSSCLHVVMANSESGWPTSPPSSGRAPNEQANALPSMASTGGGQNIIFPSLIVDLLLLPRGCPLEWIGSCQLPIAYDTASPLPHTQLRHKSGVSSSIPSVHRSPGVPWVGFHISTGCQRACKRMGFTAGK